MRYLWSNASFGSIQFSRSVVSNSLQPHELQHARPPCPSPTPGVHPNPCPSHPLFSPSPPALNLSQHQSFQISQLFASGGQSIGFSASTSVLPMNTQDWFPLQWTGWISFTRDSQESSPTPHFKSINSSVLSFL